MPQHISLMDATGDAALIEFSSNPEMVGTYCTASEPLSDACRRWLHPCRARAGGPPGLWAALQRPPGCEPFALPRPQPWTIHRNATVVTNDPPYPEQRADVQQWEQFSR